MSDPIKAMQNELACVNRQITGCDRNCVKCDLVLEDPEIIAAYEAAIEALKKQIRWIPVTERMPEEHESEIKTFDDNMNITGVIQRMVSDYCFVTIQPKKCMPHVGASFSVNGKFPDDVVAWMAVPEPYREVEE